MEGVIDLLEIHKPELRNFNLEVFVATAYSLLIAKECYSNEANPQLGRMCYIDLKLNGLFLAPVSYTSSKMSLV